MAETFFGVSMIPMNYKDEVRQIKIELLCFLRHPMGGQIDFQTFENQMSYMKNFMYIFYIFCRDFLGEPASHTALDSPFGNKNDSFLLKSL